MADTWIAIVGGVIASVVSGFSSWFFAKRKYNAEVDSSLISNMSESLEFYKALADDNKHRLDEVLAENAELRKEVSELRDQVTHLTTVLAQYGLERLVADKNNK